MLLFFAVANFCAPLCLSAAALTYAKPPPLYLKEFVPYMDLYKIGTYFFPLNTLMTRHSTYTAAAQHMQAQSHTCVSLAKGGVTSPFTAAVFTGHS